MICLSNQTIAKGNAKRSLFLRDLISWLIYRNDAAELEEVSAYIALLKAAIPDDDHVLQDYIKIVGPQMQKAYTLRSAKGSSVERYAHNDDQSMLTHVLNGVFPTLQIVRESGAVLSGIEKKNLSHCLYASRLG